MLTLTPTAAEAVRQLVASSPVDDDGGVRIAPGEPTPDGTELQLSLVDGPEPADESLDELGAHVFLEETVVPFLDDKVLDAQVKEGGITFAVRSQNEPTPGMDGRGPAA
jgi:Fe-S cluster assembly iron-binding protein IscA